MRPSTREKMKRLSAVSRRYRKTCGRKRVIVRIKPREWDPSLCGWGGRLLVRGIDWVFETAIWVLRSTKNWLIFLRLRAMRLMED